MLAWADRHLTHSATAAMFEPSHAASIRVAKKVGYANEVMGRYGEAAALCMERPRRASTPK